MKQSEFSNNQFILNFILVVVSGIILKQEKISIVKFAHRIQCIIINQFLFTSLRKRTQFCFIALIKLNLMCNKSASFQLIWACALKSLAANTIKQLLYMTRITVNNITLWWSNSKQQRLGSNIDLHETQLNRKNSIKTLPFSSKALKKLHSTNIKSNHLVNILSYNFMETTF